MAKWETEEYLVGVRSCQLSTPKNITLKTDILVTMFHGPPTGRIIICQIGKTQ